MKTVFDEYQSKGLLNSNLEKNQELKQLLLEETPWVLDAKNKKPNKCRNWQDCFDANTMRNSINDDWSELKNCKILMVVSLVRWLPKFLLQFIVYFEKFRQN